MTIGQVLFIIFIIGFIASGIILLKQSAKKFKLTDEQIKAIKAREKEQKIKDKTNME